MDQLVDFSALVIFYDSSKGMVVELSALLIKQFILN